MRPGRAAKRRASFPASSAPASSSQPSGTWSTRSGYNGRGTANSAAALDIEFLQQQPAHGAVRLRGEGLGLALEARIDAAAQCLEAARVRHLQIEDEQRARRLRVAAGGLCARVEADLAAAARAQREAGQ